MVGAALLLLALERLAPSEGLLLGLPHAEVLESLVYAVSDTRLLFAVFGGAGAAPIPSVPRRSPILGAGQPFVERHLDRGPEPTPGLLVPLKAPRNPPSLSVVVPTLNEERHVGSLLSDLMEQTKKADEVIVVDAGSGDGTISVVRRFPDVVLLNGSPPWRKGGIWGAGEPAATSWSSSTPT